MVPPMSNKLKVLVNDRQDRPMDLAGNSYDRIFCGYYFQTETGTEFMAHMPERGVATPVIFIATSMDTKGLLDAAALPMADFLVAPFPANDLKQRIRLPGGDLIAA
jgi:response regulator of citrate/malate metabolism